LRWKINFRIKKHKDIIPGVYRNSEIKEYEFPNNWFREWKNNTESLIRDLENVIIWSEDIVYYYVAGSIIKFHTLYRFYFKQTLTHGIFATTQAWK